MTIPWRHAAFAWGAIWAGTTAVHIGLRAVEDAVVAARTRADIAGTDSTLTVWVALAAFARGAIWASTAAVHIGLRAVAHAIVAACPENANSGAIADRSAVLVAGSALLANRIRRNSRGANVIGALVVIEWLVRIEHDILDAALAIAHVLMAVAPGLCRDRSIVGCIHDAAHVGVAGPRLTFLVGTGTIARLHALHTGSGTVTYCAAILLA